MKGFYKDVIFGFVWFGLRLIMDICVVGRLSGFFDFCLVEDVVSECFFVFLVWCICIYFFEYYDKKLSC